MGKEICELKVVNDEVYLLFHNFSIAYASTYKEAVELYKNKLNGLIGKDSRVVIKMSEIVMYEVNNRIFQLHLSNGKVIVVFDKDYQLELLFKNAGLDIL